MLKRSEEKKPTGVNPAKRAVRLVAAMALKDVSDGYHLGQVGGRTRNMDCGRHAEYYYMASGPKQTGLENVLPPTCVT